MTLILPGLTADQTTIPDSEKHRLEELYSMTLLDQSSDERFRGYAELAALAVAAPIAAVVLRGERGLTLKAIHGHRVDGAPRNISFAVFSMQQEGGVLSVEDASADERFASHPIVSSAPNVRACLGLALRNAEDDCLGALCVMDSKPRRFSDDERQLLVKLKTMIENEISNSYRVEEFRRKLRAHFLLDASTQLPTETLFTARLASEIRLRRAAELVVALIRIERFDAVHSAIGRAGAAFVVRSAAERLREALGDNCLMGQVREDTIAIAFGVPNEQAAQRATGLMLHCLNEPFVLGDHMLSQRVSIGTAMYPHDGADSDTLLKRARTALNATPATNIRRSRRYDRRLSTEAARQFEIETALRGALDRNELDLEFQPRVEIDSRRLVGAEALLRWSTPRLGQVSPAEFIPIAEECGLIIDLGDWVLATACARIESWQKAGHQCPEVSVNVSSLQLRQPRFCERVREVLAAHSLDPSLLNLEVTEGTLIEDIDATIRIMTQLRRSGVTFAIDDFGKGFSSLSYLTRMPLDVLKIDRAFVEGIPARTSSMTLVRSIVAMGRALGLQVVAEGVESREQLDVLRMAGCNQLQGYLISEPLTTDEFVDRFLTPDRGGSWRLPDAAWLKDPAPYTGGEEADE